MTSLIFWEGSFLLFVALVGRDWNQILTELESWDKFGREAEKVGFAVLNTSRD